MKRIICTIVAFAVLAGSAMADEGMWMLPLLKQMNGKALKEAGCELTPSQIYSINNSSLKSSIVQFGGGCTGEVISKEGLILTNHHCGYGSIQKLSSVEHDYLANGYWAMNRGEELPCEGLTVTFLEYMRDVTDILKKAMNKAREEHKGEEDVEKSVYEAMDGEYKRLIDEAERKNPYCEASIVPFYDKNVYYLIVTKEYKDIRFVGAPPSSIGKFGADTDNWMWPRHTGDFSMFRIYADKDNNPAEYSQENVPYRTKNALKISLAGIQEGDYTMIMGYPGRTTRFQTSPELQAQLDVNDIRIEARTIRQNVLMADMLADPKVKIQYASKYAGSSNGWKKWKGMKLAFGKLNIIGRAQDEEAEFSAWVNANPKRMEKYGSALEDIYKGVDSTKTATEDYTRAMESVYRIEIQNAASLYRKLLSEELKASEDTAAALVGAASKMSEFYKDYSVETDRKVAKAMLGYYREHSTEENYLVGLDRDFKTMDIDGYVDSLFRTSAFTSLEKLESVARSGDFQALDDDPALQLSRSVFSALYTPYRSLSHSQSALEQARKAYTGGLLEWKKKEPSYPDANFTMRLTYGHVMGYSPKDGVFYLPQTTLDGVMAKEDPDNWEFVVPAKLKELWKNKDFGNYALPNGKMPVAFLSNNDITGGNSGSPVLNAKGELIGLAFDGNWESMSSDVMFEPELQRCINVDIRYVLFIMDKFGGAGYLLDEMKFAK